MVRLLTLVAAAVLPLSLAACTAAALGSHARCECGSSHAGSQWAAAILYGVALALGARLLWAAVSLWRATRAALVRGAAARFATRIELTGRHDVFVLPVTEPVAYTAGLTRPQVVVSRGLLDSLEEDERRALLAHELAHARGGHQRMLFVGGVIADALGFLPPIRNAFAALRRNLEAAADAQAAVTVGDTHVVRRAIAKTALATAPYATAPAGAGSELRERLERLERPPAPSRLYTAVGAGGGAAMGLALVASTCLALHTGDPIATTLACVAALAALALPALTRPARPPFEASIV